jgi:hypothetical protein
MNLQREEEPDEATFWEFEDNRYYEDDEKETVVEEKTYQYRTRDFTAAWGPWRHFDLETPYGIGTHAEFQVREAPPFEPGYYRAKNNVYLDSHLRMRGDVILMSEKPVHNADQWEAVDVTPKKD